MNGKYFDWNDAKNLQLKAKHGIGFDEIYIALEERQLLDIIPHPNQKRYAGQKIFVVKIDSYAFLVPFVEDDEKIFLKTLYPSRKFTKKYLTKRRKQWIITTN